MVLNEFDAYVEALKKINLNEEIMPVYKGKLLTENVDIYCKVQKILGCPAMEQCHKWLYDLDVENLDESECSKVNNLFKLGVEKGYLEDENEDPEKQTDECDLMAPVVDQAVVTPTSTPVAPAPAPIQQPEPEAPMAAYVVLYSAVRDGNIKTGEAYSNSLNTRSAKADVMNQLEKAGYQNIRILAIEAGDPDMTGCDNTFIKQPEAAIPSYEAEDEEKVEEADDREPLSHAFHPVGMNASTANTIGQDAVEMTLTEDEAKAEVKKAFDAVNKEFGDDQLEKDKTRKWLDDNKDGLEKIRKSLRPEDAKNLDVITKTLEAFANGKLTEAEDELDEAKAGKKSTGLLLVLKGVYKILMTLLSLSGSGIGLTGKIITWAGRMITVGADKLNAAIPESDENLNEAGEDDADSDDSDSSDDKEDDSKDDSKDDDSSKDDDKKEEDSKDDDKKEEDAEEPDEKLKDDKKEEDGKEDAKDDKEEDELSDQEKTQLKDSYKKAFKAAMQKCKYFDKSFDDLTLEEKVKFFETIDEAWGDKADPTKFMSDKETEQLQKIVVKK